MAGAAAPIRGLEAGGLGELLPDERDRRAQLVVETLVLRPGVDLVRRDTEHREPDGDQGRERDHETEPEGHAPVLGGLRITRRSCPTEPAAVRTTDSRTRCRVRFTTGALPARV